MTALSTARAELDALIAHLYGLASNEFACILDFFPVLRTKGKMLSAK
jgi:hypothetical protein